MKINKIAVFSKNISKTIEFYKILGFIFPEYNGKNDHFESIAQNGVALMIDDYDFLKKIMKEEPEVGSTAGFALEYDSKGEIDKIISQLASRNFSIIKEPWVAFWGQYYAIVEDPEGFKVDLYVNL